MTILGVQNSGTGKQWLEPNEAQRLKAERLARIGGLDPILAGLYARRGANPENLEHFQDPKLRNLMPDPRALKDCDKAADRILQAIETKEKIAIFGDYDVDGATSCALLVDYFRHFGIEASVYIPDRLREGYGPNVKAMRALAQDHSLIICVDCGTLAFEPIQAATNEGAEVVVLDHHMAGETLPNAITVNPNRQDCDNTFGYLSAAAVVFLVLVEINRHLEGEKPDLLKALDLVAISTIADVAPLLAANRAFVRSGLERLKLKERVGLSALIERFTPNRNITAKDIGFVLAPRLNAGGRVGDASLATRLLSTQSEEEAQSLIDELERLNTARREIEADIFEEAKAQIEAQGQTAHFVYAKGENWHLGVLGIVAARLKSSFDKPALVFGNVDDVYHGSARSVEGIDLGGAVARLVRENLILKGGGHKMAAGLSIEPQKMDEAMKRFDVFLQRQAKARPQSAIHIDAVLSPGRIDLDFLDLIESAGPFGAMAPEPIFALPDLKLISKTVLKSQHLKYVFSTPQNKTLEVLAFGKRGTDYDIPNEFIYEKFHLAVSLSRNIWNARESVNLHLEDWVKSG